MLNLLSEPKLGEVSLESAVQNLLGCIEITAQAQTPNDDTSENIAKFQNDSFVIQREQFMTPEKPDEKAIIFSSSLIDQGTNTEAIESSSINQEFQNEAVVEDYGVEKVQHNVSFCEEEDIVKSVQTKLFLYQFNKMYGETTTNCHQSTTSDTSDKSD